MRIGIIALIVLGGAALVAARPGRQDASPVDRQAAFLKSIQGGKVKGAYEQIIKDGPLTMDVCDKLVAEAKKGIELYGDAAEFENLGLVREDKHIAMGIGILCTERTPLFFYFVWYRPTEKDAWRLVNTWFNDQTKEYFSLRR